MIASIRRPLAKNLGLGLFLAAATSPLFSDSLFHGSLSTNTASAQEPSTTYKLEYKLKEGELLKFRVEHLAKTKVKVSDTEEMSQMRTVSAKIWQVTEVSDTGDMTFDNGIESVEMTQQAGEAEEIRWTSSSDEIPPVQFSGVAKRLGKILSTITINAQGQVTKRTGESADSSSLGMGDITMPLPKDPVAVGGKWSVPRNIKLKNKDGVLKAIKIRELYTLDKVQTGIATITVRSEPLTPIEDQEMRGQLVQQLSNGSIRFDIDSGRVLSRQLDWDEEVVGFQGPASNLNYQARLTETLEASPPKSATLQGPLTR